MNYYGPSIAFRSPPLILDERGAGDNKRVCCKAAQPLRTVMPPDIAFKLNREPETIKIVCCKAPPRIIMGPAYH